MITRGRPQAARAVECFRAQTYPERELVVIHDYDDTKTREFLSTLQTERMRIVAGLPGMLLGDLRNLSVTEAVGDLVAQWDDDDWYHPNRLAQQVTALGDAAACFLSRWTLVDETDGTRRESMLRAWEGSMVARKAALRPYPSLSRGEDTPVAIHLLENHKVAFLNEPHLYEYCWHGGNVVSHDHFRALARVR